MSTAVHAATSYLQVNQQVQLDLPPADVWSIISTFSRVHDWHPAVIKTEISGGADGVPGAVRRLTFGNGATLDERLTSYEPQNRRMAYTITAGEFPVSDYTTVLEVQSLPDARHSLVTWRGSFRRADTSASPAAGRDDVAATTAVTGVYSTGLKALENLAADRRAIKEVISYYADGGTGGDATTVAKAFHPSATMKFVREGKLIDEPIEKFLANYIPAGLTQARTVVIDNIDVRGAAAAARITIDYPTHQFIDYFNLLRIEGRWLIVSKIFNRVQKS